MKRILSILLIAVFTLSIAACRPGTGSTAAAPTAAPTAASGDDLTSKITPEPVTGEPSATPAPEATEGPAESRPTEDPSVVRPVEVNKEDYPTVFTSADVFFILYPDGNLYGWGNNEYGQLGLGNTDNRNRPVHIAEGLTPVIVGPTVFALGTSGTLWGWGLNDRAQLGLGDTENRTSPVELMYNVVKVCSGINGIYALTESGELYRWSWPEYNSLTDGEKAALSTPQLVAENVAYMEADVYVTENGELFRRFYPDEWRKLAENVKRVFGEYGAMTFEDTDGRLWRFGEGFEKTLICESFKECYVSSENILGNTYVLMEDGGLWFYNEEEARLELVLEDVKEFWADCWMDEDWGYLYRFALKENGELWGWAPGYNRYIVGIDDEEYWDFTPRLVAADVREVLSNGAVSYIIKVDGSVWAAGEGTEEWYIHAALGSGDANKSFVFVRTGVNNAAAVFTQLSMEFGLNEEPDGTDGIEVYSRTFAVDTDGRIWAWGWNGDGLLGVDSTDTDVLSPMEIYIARNKER